MPRHLNLRQIEAFKAVIENGGISSAAEIVHISQPAMSKLIAHFEADTGLKLFDRLKGRLAPTACGMRLYKEIDRIFAGVRQVENAAEAIRREERGQLVVGVMPALSGSFIQRATVDFLKDRRSVFCSIQTLSSPWIVDRLVSRKLDVGLWPHAGDGRTGRGKHRGLPKRHRVGAAPGRSLLEPRELEDLSFRSR
jgi:DNA-binding transcriptional LysR family regulator